MTASGIIFTLTVVTLALAAGLGIWVARRATAAKESAKASAFYRDKV